MSVNTKMTAIANAIRSKTGETESLTLDAMATAINGLSPAVQVGTIEAGDNYLRSYTISGLNSGFNSFVLIGVGTAGASTVNSTRISRLIYIPTMESATNGKRVISYNFNASGVYTGENYAEGSDLESQISIDSENGTITLNFTENYALRWQYTWVAFKV